MLATARENKLHRAGGKEERPGTERDIPYDWI